MKRWMLHAINVLLLLPLQSCEKDPNELILGKWEMTETEYQFYKEGEISDYLSISSFYQLEFFADGTAKAYYDRSDIIDFDIGYWNISGDSLCFEGDCVEIVTLTHESLVISDWYYGEDLGDWDSTRITTSFAKID